MKKQVPNHTRDLILAGDKMVSKLKNLPQEARHLLLFHTSHANGSKQHKYSYATIHEITGLSKATITKYNKVFRDLGIISWKQGHSNQYANVSNLYELNLTGMQELAKLTQEELATLIAETVQKDSAKDSADPAIAVADPAKPCAETVKESADPTKPCAETVQAGSNNVVTGQFLNEQSKENNVNVQSASADFSDERIEEKSDGESEPKILHPEYLPEGKGPNDAAIPASARLSGSAPTNTEVSPAKPGTVKINAPSREWVKTFNDELNACRADTNRSSKALYRLAGQLDTVEEMKKLWPFLREIDSTRSPEAELIAA